MRHPQLIFSLRIVHEWYGDTTPAISVRPAASTHDQFRQHRLVFGTANGQFEVYAYNDDFSGAAIEFDVISKDPFLITRTFTGQRKEHPLVAKVTLTAEECEKRVTPADWKRAQSLDNEFAKVSVILPSAPLPLTATLRIPSISTYWTYVVTGRELPDNLEVRADDGSEHFTEIPVSAAGNGVPTRSFRSPAPRVSIRNVQSRYQLVSEACETALLIPRLPYPAPGVLPQPIPGGNAVEDLIYVNV